MLTAAGAAALVAGPPLSNRPPDGRRKQDAMEKTEIPDRVRVRALKGFRAHVNGQFSVVNPGDVVTVDKATAIDLRQSNKAVMTTDAERIQKDYLPERKRIQKAASKETKGAVVAA